MLKLNYSDIIFKLNKMEQSQQEIVEIEPFTDKNLMIFTLSYIEKFIHSIKMVTIKSIDTLSISYQLPKYSFELCCVNCKKTDFITPIPIGPHPNFKANQEDLPKDIFVSKIYSNWAGRDKLEVIFQTMDFITHFQTLPMEEYAKILKRSVFTLSPKGWGYDSYRTWEAVESNCIPIVEHMEEIDDFTDYPILYIDSFKNLTKDLLINHLKEKGNEIYKKFL